MDKEKSKVIKAPKCWSDDGKHVLEPAEPPFYAECQVCGERFILISETVAKEIEIVVASRKP